MSIESQTVLNPTITIIGDGASAAACLVALSRQVAPETSILVLGKHALLGSGLAYGQAKDYQLLNVPSDRIWIDTLDQDGFIDWLKKHKHSQPLATLRFVPRVWFADFIHESLAKISDKFTFLQDPAVQFYYQFFPKAHWVIKTEENRTIRTQFLILCTGFKGKLSIPSKIHRSDQVINSGRILQPFSDTTYDHIKPHDTVTILGSGLTAIDAYLTARKKTKLPITMISRHGLLPLRYDPENHPVRADIALPDMVGLTPTQILQLVRMLHDVYKIEWQELGFHLIGQNTAIWTAWSDREKNQYYRHLCSYWQVIRHRMPPEMHDLINQEIASGRLIVQRSLLLSVDYQAHEQSVVLHLRRPGTLHQTTQHTHWLILANGFTPDTKLLTSSFTAKKAYRDQVFPNYFLIGPAARESLFEATAMFAICERAFHIARKIQNTLATDKTYNLFQAHPANVSETYGEHFRYAFLLSLRLLKNAFTVFCHGTFPFMFTRTTSEDLRSIALALTRRNSVKTRRVSRTRLREILQQDPYKTIKKLKKVA